VIVTLFIKPVDILHFVRHPQNTLRKNGVGFYTHGKQLDHSKVEDATTQWKIAS
jgi:hypothetical protein